MLNLAVRFILIALILSGCMSLYRGDPGAWYSAWNGVPPAGGNRVFVCHGFGCHLKTAVTFSQRDIAAMRRMLGKPRDAAAERKGIADLVAWAERRVADAAGSAGDIGGLDMHNARRRGQMDCIDEATNTTSYLLVAEAAGLLAHHRVGHPVARGYFLDGRYPHATAVVVADDGVPWAVDSWKRGNGKEPEIITLDAWFAQSPAS